jgi:hypothetical protein
MELRVSKLGTVKEDYIVNIYEKDELRDWVSIEVEHENGKLREIRLSGNFGEARLPNLYVKALLETIKNYKL